MYLIKIIITFLFLKLNFYSWQFFYNTLFISTIHFVCFCYRWNGMTFFPQFDASSNAIYIKTTNLPILWTNLNFSKFHNLIALIKITVNGSWKIIINYIIFIMLFLGMINSKKSFRKIERNKYTETLFPEFF